MPRENNGLPPLPSTYTREELLQLAILIFRGLSNVEIGEKMGRSTSWVGKMRSTCKDLDLEVMRNRLCDFLEAGIPCIWETAKLHRKRKDRNST